MTFPEHHLMRSWVVPECSRRAASLGCISKAARRTVFSPACGRSLGTSPSPFRPPPAPWRWGLAAQHGAYGPPPTRSSPLQPICCSVG